MLHNIVGFQALLCVQCSKLLFFFICDAENREVVVVMCCFTKNVISGAPVACLYVGEAGFLQCVGEACFTLEIWV